VAQDSFIEAPASKIQAFEVALAHPAPAPTSDVAPDQAMQGATLTMMTTQWWWRQQQRHWHGGSSGNDGGHNTTTVVVVATMTAAVVAMTQRLRQQQ